MGAPKWILETNCGRCYLDGETIDHDAIMAFTRGHCLTLARCLARVLNWEVVIECVGTPYGAVVDGNGYFENDIEPEDLIYAFNHAWVLNPNAVPMLGNNSMLDIRGWRNTWNPWTTVKLSQKRLLADLQDACFPTNWAAGKTYAKLVMSKYGSCPSMHVSNECAPSVYIPLPGTGREKDSERSSR